MTDMYKSGRIAAVIAIILYGRTIDCADAMLAVSPIIQPCSRARRSTKKALKVVKWLAFSLKG